MIGLFKKKKSATYKNDQVIDLLESLRSELSTKLESISRDISEINVNLELLEKRFNYKELKDKQQWGHLQYKLQEVKSAKSEAQILAEKLNKRVV